MLFTRVNGKCQLIIMLFALLFSMSGCSIQPLRLVRIESDSLKVGTDIPMIDPNSGPYLVSEEKKGPFPYFAWQIDESITQDKPCRVKYNWWYHTIAKMVAVDGRIGYKGKKYPMVLDTGSPGSVIVINDIHVRKNKLAIYRLGSDNGGWGMCHLPELWIGNASLQNFRCIYHGVHMDLELFGLRIDRDKTIIVGLPAMRKFKYIAFDGIRKEVEFSLNESFASEKTRLWSKYPFRIDSDLENDVCLLLVRIPIAGKEEELRLDTGGPTTLILSQELWKNVNNRIQNVELGRGKTAFPGHGEGVVAGNKVVAKLQVGNRIVRNAIITILPNDSSVVQQAGGLLGMHPFEDTVMVLDFERNIMWIKNNGPD